MADDGTGGPKQRRAEILSHQRIGDYYVVTLVESAIADAAQPGQFISLSVGGPVSSMLLRRTFSLYRVNPHGAYAGTIAVAFNIRGAGTAWLAQCQPGDQLDVTGPLGRPFSLPDAPHRVALVGSGYGSASLFPLADALKGRGCRLDFVLGAPTASELFGEIDAKRVDASLTVMTSDGSHGTRGTAVDGLLRVIGHADVVYAAGPTAMLRAVNDIAAKAEIRCEVAIEEPIACGIGICQSCVLPVTTPEGAIKMVRSCVDGPTFSAHQVRWSEIGVIPSDVLEGSVTAHV